MAGDTQMTITLTPPDAPVHAEPEVLSGLLHRCAQHDEAALARLYKLTSPWIYTLVTRHTSSASVAENAMVAIYARVWRQAACHVEHDQSVLAWMTIIAFEEIRRV